MSTDLTDASAGRVMIELNATGQVADAWFDLAALPRVEKLLKGRSVADASKIIERLCSICPVAHHLASARALDASIGVETLTPTADAVRRLLHYGSVLQTHALRLSDVDATVARALYTFARDVVGSSSGQAYFPRCAVPGGVTAPIEIGDRDRMHAVSGAAVLRAHKIVQHFEGSPGISPSATYRGHDVALVDDEGALDLLGDELRAVAADGSVVLARARAAEWSQTVAESRPDQVASRPYLRAVGAEFGGYRVGPVAQLLAATRLTTPRADRARQRWLLGSGGASWARAVVALHTAEIIEALLGSSQLVAGPLLAPPSRAPTPAGTSRDLTGWVDGARGLLVHHYRAGPDQLLTSATITTPTAQNEPWLAVLLKAAAHEHLTSLGAQGDGLNNLPRRAMEAAVQEADPCLPITSLPVGQMGLQLTVLGADGEPITGGSSAGHLASDDVGAPAHSPDSGT